jgi:PAS domain S-box-containing protein
MNSTEFQLRDGSDPRLAAHAASPWPASLWSFDGAHILWANPAGANFFGAADAAALAGRTFGPADPHRRQVAKLAGRLLSTGAVRLERLRGFGAAQGGLATCACARLDFSDGGSGVLVIAMLTAGELQRLERAGRTAPDHRARPLPESSVHAEIESAHQPDAAAMDRHAPEYERPEVTGEAPAEFALIDESERQATESGAEQTGTDKPVFHDEEPSPFVETVADEPTQPWGTDATPANDETSAPRETPAVNELPPPLQTIEPRHGAVAVPAWLDQPLHPRRHPLRFIWQMDAEGRFQLGSDEFTRLIGARTAAGFGRLWSEIAQAFGLDPDGRVLAAIATRDTWSGIALDWPVDGGEHLRVELSGLPMFDRARNFVGYRGFGVCRDLDGLARLDALRRYELFSDAALPADVASPRVPEPSASRETENSHPTDLEHAVEPPKNVLPFRPANEPKSPSLTPVENNAFNELARQLAARLQSETAAAEPVAMSDAPEPVAEPAAPEAAAPSSDPPGWLSEPAPSPRGVAARDRTLLDLVPAGVLIWRLDRLLYANRAFLDRVGHDSLQALEEAGGLDALLVQPGVSSASSSSQTGTPVTISASYAAGGQAPSTTDARLHAIEWDGEGAHALICDIPRTGDEAEVAARPSPVGHANAEELGAILDTTTEGIVMFDAEGNLNCCNRSAEALFGYDGDELVRRNLAELFAPESRDAVQNYLASIRQADAASLDHGREVLGRVREGGLIPLSVTIGRTQPQGPNFFAVFHDLSRAKNSEAELTRARRSADQSLDARVDALARVSHEVRTPLNAIIGFADMMIEQRFGALGNERYVEYMKDIRASGERVIAIINDQLDLSRIEIGKLDLNFASQNLNELVEQCVAAMQPQANRERIIIRTSLAHGLPAVVADGGALRQIALNLIGTSIHLANAGGQVIVSTALSDAGEVMLRVRDTGHGLNDNEVAAALEPFGNTAPSEQSAAAGVSLSLTKALVEANRAQFHIKPGAQSGTLMEVVFGNAVRG